MLLSPARLSAGILLPALILTASSAGVAALKLTSLGSTLDDDSPRGADLSAAPVDSAVDLSALACSSLATCSSAYGVDRSFPVHHPAAPMVTEDASAAAARDDNPLGREAKGSFYREFMAGCHETYEARACDVSEAERMEMNLRQPVSMNNYTTLGFHKVRAPPLLRSLLAKFWTQHSRSLASAPNETWDFANTYTNHWAAPTKMLPLDPALRRPVWDAARAALEDWLAGEGGAGTAPPPPLSPSSLYGVRVYTAGAILAPHVDRTPLVLSAIINVAQDVDAPWAVELYGHDGRAYNVTMEPGDMVLYESHSVIHGRPFPLEGRHYANVFAHFEPRGHALGREEEGEREEEPSLEELYRRAWEKARMKCSEDEDEDEGCRGREDLNVVERVPRYIVPGSEEERRWLQTHPKASLVMDTGKDKAWVKSLSAHTASSTGDLEALVAIAAANPDALQHRDNNGWNPLHEAVRGGHLEVVKYLLDEVGLDENERTHAGNGGSPLWWAKKTHGKIHPVVQYLEGIGALENPPDGHKIKGGK